MKTSMNLLLWTAAADHSHLPLLKNIKHWGFDGVELPMFSHDGSPWKELDKVLDDLELGRTVVACLPQGTSSPLENGFGNVMAVPTVVQNHMQVHQGIRRDRLPEDLDQLSIELPDLLGRKLKLVDEPRPPAEIESRSNESVFHRQRETPVAVDPGLVSDRLQNRPPQTDPGVFHRMVVIDMQISDSLDGQIKQPVLSQQRQHVIEKADTGFDL